MVIHLINIILLMRSLSNVPFAPPKYGPCWLSALSSLSSTCSQLSSTCSQLSENTQARLDLQLTNCFLAQAGQK